MSVSTECQFPLLTFQNGKYKTYFSVFMATLDKTYRRMATTTTSFDRDPRDGNSGKKLIPLELFVTIMKVRDHHYISA